MKELLKEPGLRIDRSFGPISRAVGVYQTFLRRSLEHFFPDASLEAASDRSVIHVEPLDAGTFYTIGDDPHGLGVEVELFRTRYLIQPGSPRPFRPSERRLIEAILRVLEARFRTFFDAASVVDSRMYHYALEDLVLTEYLDPPRAVRLPGALEALRAAALTTYENRRLSTGALLLGTPCDPADPARPTYEGAPSYNIRLAGIKGFSRLCDGVRTLFLVDLQGDIARVIDIDRWAEFVHGPGPLPAPCPRAYAGHARATQADRHVALVLTPAQEIKVFVQGVMAFAYSDARWRLLDIPTKFAAWREAVGPIQPSGLAETIFQAALNLAEDRKGALFVVLRDPAEAAGRLIAPGDRIAEEVVADDPEDPENLSPRLAKRALHHVVRGRALADLDVAVVEALAGLDGAVVTDRNGRLLTFGAILRIGPEAMRIARAVEGARTLAALAASFDGPVLKVSEDGYLTMYLGGRRLWEL